MITYGEELDDVRRVMEFDDAKGNFMAAARYGLSAELRWLGGQRVNARDLILSDLLPRAREGLAFKGIERGAADRYLDLIEERVSSGRTGPSGPWTPWRAWERVAPSTSATGRWRRRPMRGKPRGCRSTRALADLDEISDWRHSFRTVGQIMSRDLFTLHPEDVIDLAASLMDWEHIRYVPVEDDEGKLCGLVSQRMILRLLIKRQASRAAAEEPIAVKEVMIPEPIIVSPKHTTLQAMRIMRERKISCLPVVEGERLVGDHHRARLHRCIGEAPRGDDEGRLTRGREPIRSRETTPGWALVRPGRADHWDELPLSPVPGDFEGRRCPRWAS